MDQRYQARRRKRLKNKRINRGMFQTFQKRRSEEDSWSSNLIVTYMPDAEIISAPDFHVL